MVRLTFGMESTTHTTDSPAALTRRSWDCKSGCCCAAHSLAAAGFQISHVCELYSCGSWRNRLECGTAVRVATTSTQAEAVRDLCWWTSMRTLLESNKLQEIKSTRHIVTATSTDSGFRQRRNARRSAVGDTAGGLQAAHRDSATQHHSTTHAASEAWHAQLPTSAVCCLPRSR